MHVVVSQNLPNLVQGFFEDRSLLFGFNISGTFKFSNVNTIKWRHIHTKNITV